MANSVTNWVWGHSESRHGARLVLLFIADSMRTEDGWAWPSNKEIGDKTKLAERAVQSAITDLAKLGELEVQYNAGPKGCNRYRVLMTPAESAPPQNLHPANNAPPQSLRGQASSQDESPTPADNAPPADSAGVQISTPPPAESAPGTIKEPKTKNSLSESSTAQNSLFPGAEITSGADSGKRSRGRPPKTGPDPLFDEWYATYPVHKARGDAEPAWTKALREGADPQVLIAAAKHYRRDPQVLRGYGKYPATWLNKKCWLDEDVPEAQDTPPASAPKSTTDQRVAQAQALKLRLASRNQEPA